MEEAPIEITESLTSGRLLVRNVLWNGAGEIGPLIAAFIAMPILIHSLGIERFGILALAWTVFGYFTLFDLGVGTAMTKFASDLLARKHPNEVPALYWTGLAIMAVLGAIGACALAMAAHLLVYRVLRIPIALQRETLAVFYLLAFGLFVHICAGPPQAMLAAYQRFKILNLIRSPGAIVSSLGPLGVLPFSHNIAVIIALLVLNQVAAWIAYFACCAWIMPEAIGERRLKPSIVPELVSFGGWETASNLFAGLTHGIDRFLLAAMVSVTAVSYYVVPSRILNKLHKIQWLIISVLYPAFAHDLAENRERARALFELGAKLILLALIPIVVVAVFFAPQFLTLWMDAAVAKHSSLVLQLLAISIILDSMGGIASSLVTAAHRPDINAKIHAVLLPLYLIFAVVMIRWQGAVGAAIICLARAGADSVAHWITAQWFLPAPRTASVRFSYFVFTVLACLLAGMLPLGFEARCVTVAAIVAFLYAGAWYLLLTKSDQQTIGDYFVGLFWRARARVTGTALATKGDL